jgi:hypothetical protein
VFSDRTLHSHIHFSHISHRHSIFRSTYCQRWTRTKSSGISDYAGDQFKVDWAPIFGAEWGSVNLYTSLCTFRMTCWRKVSIMDSFTYGDCLFVWTGLILRYFFPLSLTTTSIDIFHLDSSCLTPRFIPYQAEYFLTLWY